MANAEEKELVTMLQDFANKQQAKGRLAMGKELAERRCGNCYHSTLTDRRIECGVLCVNGGALWRDTNTYFHCCYWAPKDDIRQAPSTGGK